MTKGNQCKHHYFTESKRDCGHQNIIPVASTKIDSRSSWRAFFRKVGNFDPSSGTSLRSSKALRKSNRIWANFFLQHDLSKHKPLPNVLFPRYEQEVADEIKVLDGEYDKLNEVLAHGAVDGYGQPFLAQ